MPWGGFRSCHPETPKFRLGAAQVGGTTQTSGGGEGPHAPPPFGGGPIAKVINSQSANVDVGSLPLTRNEQWILTANVRVAGTIRCAPGLCDGDKIAMLHYWSIANLETTRRGATCKCS